MADLISYEWPGSLPGCHCEKLATTKRVGLCLDKEFELGCQDVEEIRDQGLPRPEMEDAFPLHYFPTENISLKYNTDNPNCSSNKDVLSPTEDSLRILLDSTDD